MALHYHQPKLISHSGSDQATPFRTACKAVEQVIECEISGPELCKSWATQKKYFPKVVGEAKVCALPVLNTLIVFSNKSATRGTYVDSKTSFEDQPAFERFSMKPPWHTKTTYPEFYVFI
jgi:hypothetical protein